MRTTKRGRWTRELLACLSGFLLLTALVGCSKNKGDDEDSSEHSCLPEETDCEGVCADTRSSDEHCGSCGNLCSVGEVCDAGACRAIGIACPAGRTLCAGACFDLATSTAHCGTCDTSCGAGPCAEGVCTSAAGEPACGASCANLLTHTSHCGGCDAPCQPGQLCAGGACECEPGLTQCTGGCSDIAAD